MRMSVTLRAKLEALKLVSFQFVNFTKDVSSPDKETGKRVSYFQVELAQPIPRVEASTSLYNPEDGKRVHDFKENVTHVKFSIEMIDKYEDDKFIFEEKDGQFTGKGSYEGNLFFDLSRAGDVWLTDTKFVKFGQEGKAKEQKQRIGSILQRRAALTTS